MADKPKTIDQQIHDKMIIDLQARRDKHSQIIRIATSDQRAGEPMTFYCTACGQELETKDELFLFAPDELCSECKGMEVHGWLDTLRPFPHQGGEHSYQLNV